MSEKIAFNVDAYTARLIGRENVSTLDGGLLELIKNGYDANANISFIYYEESSKSLFIADNGSGMTKEDIINNWMTIGSSSKRNEVKKNGRIQTGSKGIGRFALDKLASKCTMFTKTNDSSFIWEVDWDSFDTGKKITETYAEMHEYNKEFNEFISNVKNQAIKKLIQKHFNSTGTIFKLTSLREDWGNALLKKLKSKLSTVLPPDNNRGFKLYFFMEDTEKKDALIIQNMVDNYDYKVEFKVSEDGMANIKIDRNEFDFRNDLKLIKQEGNFKNDDFRYFDGNKIKYDINILELLGLNENINFHDIGSFYGELFFYKKSSTANDKEKYYYKDFSQRQKISEKFGGIKIYRDNFRVKPYGDYQSSNFDWLLLDNRKSKSPAAPSHKSGNWRVNSEQIIGQVYISRLNINLMDQANREGIIETNEFMLFKDLLINFIGLIEEDRQYVMRKLSDFYFKKNESEKNELEIKEKSKKINDFKILKDTNLVETNKKSIENLISNKLQENTDTKNDINAIKIAETIKLIEVEKVMTVIEKKELEIKNLEDENKMLRVLATTGIITNTYMHEFKAVVQDIGRSLKLADIFNKKKDSLGTQNHINEARIKRKEANNWFKITIDSFKQDRRTMKKHNINDLLKTLCNSWEKVLEKRGITIEIEDCSEINYSCFPYEIESIFNNLITNSVTASQKKINENGIDIKITLDEVDYEYKLIYHDNGPGISKKYKKNPYKILEALESDKRDENNDKIGTGMGMWIIDKTISSYNGKINLDKLRKMDEGFYIEMILPKKGQRRL